MGAPEITEEMKNDLNLLKYRGVLENDRFKKKSDRRGNSKFIQLGTYMDSAEVHVTTYIRAELFAHFRIITTG